MKDRFVRIRSVDQGSIAEEAGIEQGDALISINGEKIKDIFDYRFLIANEELLLEIRKNGGEVWEIEIEKDEYEDLGIEFESSMIDDAKSCTNKCVFCFIDQLPKGMRNTLYFKDDDSRLSFLMGNYVTLTNMKDDDIDRIIRYRMSPINVSVHTTNSDLRKLMLKNRFAGNVMDRIKKMTEAGITVNCQIVLCRDINDGSELERTLTDLTVLSPGIKSISVVPVGITRYREGLNNLKPFDKQSSMLVVSQIERWQEQLLEKHSSRIVYLADEFYIMAGRAIPEYESYEDFPQIENGVGMIAHFRHEFSEHLEMMCSSYEKESSLPVPGTLRNISIITGVSAGSYIKEMAEILEKKFNSIKIYVYDIKNDFFGENVTVTGLLTGKDIVSQLKGKELGDELLICRCMLKAGEEIFLDDYTVDMVEKDIGTRITVVENNGRDFIDKAIGYEG